MNLSPLNSFISHTFRVGDKTGATHYFADNEFYLVWRPYLGSKFQIVYFPQDPGILKCFSFARPLSLTSSISAVQSKVIALLQNTFACLQTRN